MWWDCYFFLFFFLPAPNTKFFQFSLSETWKLKAKKLEERMKQKILCKSTKCVYSTMVRTCKMVQRFIIINIYVWNALSIFNYVMWTRAFDQQPAINTQIFLYMSKRNTTKKRQQTQYDFKETDCVVNTFYAKKITHSIHNNNKKMQHLILFHYILLLI